MYHNFTEEELRALCRRNVESLEMWARRLIHEKFTEKYGTEYIDCKTSEDNYLIKREVREHVHRMASRKLTRFPRTVDTLFFEHIIYFLCNPVFYRELFEDALRYAYPEGCKEVRTFLERITPVRNALSHANPISVRQAEQVVCYCQDFIDGVKRYYKEKGVEQVWNVPRIIRIADSVGNVYNNPVDGVSLGAIYKLPQQFRCGDTYSVSVDLDPTFAETEYDIIWKNQNRDAPDFKNHNHFMITFGESDIAQVHTITCTIISHKSWHKYQYHDCQVTLMFSVFPPL